MLVLALTAGAFTLFVQPLTPVPAWVAPLAALVLLAPCPWLGYMTWKTGGHARDTTMLVLRNGMLGTDTRIVPRNKIQYATSTANPFQRRLGLASISVRTAAGAGGTAVSLHDVERRDRPRDPFVGRAEDRRDGRRPRLPRTTSSAAPRPTAS